MFQGGKDLVTKAKFADFFPDLLDWIHLRCVWWDVKEYDIFRYFQSFGFMPRSAIAAKQNDIIRILLRQVLEKKIHTHCVALRHDKKATIASERFYCPKGITILPYMVAGNTRTAPFLAPAVFRLVDSSKAGLILKHEPYVLIFMGSFQFLDRRVNFFENSMSSLLAFLGCLLRGMTLRHPCRCSTQYICPFPTGWSTAF